MKRPASSTSHDNARQNSLPAFLPVIPGATSPQTSSSSEPVLLHAPFSTPTLLSGVLPVSSTGLFRNRAPSDFGLTAGSSDILFSPESADRTSPPDDHATLPVVKERPAALITNSPFFSPKKLFIPGPVAGTALPLHPHVNSTAAEEQYSTVDPGHSPSGQTLRLINAMQSGNERMAMHLLLNGANPFVVDASKCTLLHLAAVRGMQKLAGLLIEKGLNLDARDHRGASALHLAVQNNQGDFVIFLRTCEAKLYLMDDRGRSALHCAVQQKLHHLLHVLFHPSLLNILTKENESLLDAAAQIQDFHTLNFLVEKNVRINCPEIRDRPGALHRACLQGNFEIARFLVAYGADLALRDGEMRTALHHAVPTQNLKLLGLVCNGDLIEARDALGRTPFLAACAGGYEESAFFLADHQKADLLACDAEGRNALFLASSAKNIHLADFLLLKGVPFMSDFMGCTPLMRAAEMGQINLVDRLIRAGVPRGGVARDGTNALWRAISSASPPTNLTLVKLLLRHGESLNVRDANQWSPLMIARNRNDRALANFLVQNGAVE